MSPLTVASTCVLYPTTQAEAGASHTAPSVRWPTVRGKLCVSAGSGMHAPRSLRWLCGNGRVYTREPRPRNQRLGAAGVPVGIMEMLAAQQPARGTSRADATVQRARASCASVESAARRGGPTCGARAAASHERGEVVSSAAQTTHAAHARPCVFGRHAQLGPGGHSPKRAMCATLGERRMGGGGKREGGGGATYAPTRRQRWQSDTAPWRGGYKRKRLSGAGHAVTVGADDTTEHTLVHSA